MSDSDYEAADEGARAALLSAPGSGQDQPRAAPKGRRQRQISTSYISIQSGDIVVADEAGSGSGKPADDDAEAPHERVEFQCSLACVPRRAAPSSKSCRATPRRLGPCARGAASLAGARRRRRRCVARGQAPRYAVRRTLRQNRQYCRLRRPCRHGSAGGPPQPYP